MPFLIRRRTEAEKRHRQTFKELERVAKSERKHAAKETKAHEARIKQEQQRAKRQEQQVRKGHKKALQVAKKVAKTRIRLARKMEKERTRRIRQQVRRARLQSTVRDAETGPPFAKSVGCYVCGKTFGLMLHRRRHHCRQCRESCCLQCTSRTRHSVLQYGLDKPQKVCVVCETLVFTNADRSREPVEAMAALAASRRPTTLRRPQSAPVPLTTGVAVAMRSTRRDCARSTSGKLWMLPIRPLLKKKKSAEQRRNRKMDLDLQMEKQVLVGGRTIEFQPQVIAPVAP